MNELIKVEMNESHEPTMSARELHEFLEIETPYRLWFPRMCEYGFSENQDYTPYNFVHPQNNQETTDHIVSLDMAKEIAMIQRSEKGKIARQYFLEIEKDYNSPEKVMARALRIAEATLSTLRIRIEQDKPKVEFFDAVADSKSAIEIGQAAKVLDFGKGRNTLFQILREEGLLMANNEPKQEYIDRGYFRVIEQKFKKPNGDTEINIKTLVYQKGLDYIRKLIERRKAS